MSDSFIGSIDQLHNINRVKDDPFHRQKKRNGRGFSEILDEQKSKAAEAQTQAAVSQPKVDTFATMSSSPAEDTVALAYYRARMAKR